MATTLNEFVQLVKVVGGEEAVRILKELGVDTANLGKDTEQAGEKSAKASSMVDDLGAAGLRMVSQYAGLQGILNGFRQFVAYLEDIVRLQKELSDNAAGLADDAKTLGAQIGVDEEKSVSLLTQARIAGGLDRTAAREGLIAADIAFTDQGGLLSGANLKTSLSVLRFAGAAGFQGDDTAKLFSFLKAADRLKTPEDAELALAQIAAAGRKSKAASIGEYVGQLERGGLGYLQAKVPMQDVLEYAGQTRQVEVNAQLAATVMEQFLQVAVAGADPKFGNLIRRRAKQEGIDVRSMTSADKVRLGMAVLNDIDSQESENRVLRTLGPERGLALTKAFRESNVEATAAIGEAARAATPDIFQLEVERGTRQLGTRLRQNEAAREFQEYQAGKELLTITQARERAEAMVDSDVARGVNRFGFRREANVERYVLELLRQERTRLSREGLDVTQVDAELGKIVPFEESWLRSNFSVISGYSDATLAAIAHEIDEIKRRQSLDRQTELQQQINITNIGTQFNAADPLHDPEPVRDFNQ